MLGSIGSTVRQGLRLDDVLIIDAHGHIGAWAQFPFVQADAEGLLVVMDRIGIDRLAISGIVGAVGADPSAGNDLVLDAVRRFPERFIGLCVVFPDDADAALDELLRCEAGGVRALKIHNTQGFDYGDVGYKKAFARAQTIGYAVLAHTWGGPELSQLGQLAREYPGITWIAGHSPFKPESYVELAQAHSNVFLELSVSRAPYGLVEFYVNELGAERLLYGSDMAFSSASTALGRIGLADLDDRAKRRILGENAKIVYGI